MPDPHDHYSDELPDKGAPAPAAFGVTALSCCAWSLLRNLHPAGFNRMAQEINNEENDDGI